MGIPRGRAKRVRRVPSRYSTSAEITQFLQRQLKVAARCLKVNSSNAALRVEENRVREPELSHRGGKFLELLGRVRPRVFGVGNEPRERAPFDPIRRSFRHLTPGCNRGSVCGRVGTVVAPLARGDLNPAPS